ncbi:MAG: DMT family transporter [Rhodanobacteraceae bacterium]
MSHLSGGVMAELAVYLLAIAAALTHAAGQVLQRKSSRTVPEKEQESTQLFRDLFKKPLWLAGIAITVFATILQVAALSFGALATVQTVTILELPFALIGAAWFLGGSLRWRDWCYIGVMTLGTAGVVAFLDPQGGHATNISGLTWGIALAATIVPIVVLYAFTRRAESARDAALLGAATGICFALFAALMKGVTLQFHEGALAVVTSWQIYLAILSAIAGGWLMQNAVHAGKLVAAQPGIKLLDPAVAIVWGALVFHGRMRGGLFIIMVVLSAAAIAVSAVMLAKSPQVDEKASEKR